MGCVLCLFGKQHHQSGGSFFHGILLYLELEENGLFKKKLWGKDDLSRLPGKHGMRGKFSGDRTCLILSPIFKNDDWKGKQKGAAPFGSGVDRACHAPMDTLPSMCWMYGETGHFSVMRKNKLVLL